MPKLDPTTFKTMPWKNGGGLTIEALTLPPGADLDTFELRISMARVLGHGPFSIFPGIDRTLVVLEGHGMTLAMGDGASVTLDPTSAPFSFAGDQPVYATLRDSPVVDFNVMTRRTALRHHATRVWLQGELRFACAGETSLLLVLDGTLSTANEVLQQGALFTASPDDPLVVLHTTSPTAALLRIDVFRLP